VKKVNRGEDVVLLLIAGLVPVLLAVGILVLVWVSATVRSAYTTTEHIRVTPAERAETLLRDVLDEREYSLLRKRGYLDISSPTDDQRIYRIPRHAGLVRVYERGIAVRELCVQPAEPLPSADVVAMHKLMIQACEEEYLGRARSFPSLIPNQRYRP
jgi:hypothetical protein